MAWPSPETWVSPDRLATAGWIAVTWALALVAMHLSDRLFDRVDAKLTRYNVPERRLSKLDTLADALIVAVAVLVTLSLLGIGEALWGAIALTSVAGVVVGLAAQRFGENLIAGAVILFERPFQVGDTIEVDERIGTVEAVTLHSTTLRDPDGLRITLPNQEVLDGAVTNLSACRKRRISVDVEVEAGPERLDEARYAVRQAAEGDEHLVEGEPVQVFVSASLDDGVQLTARYWVEPDAYADHCLPTALSRVLDGLHEAGFATAMPTQRVHIRE